MSLAERFQINCMMAVFMGMKIYEQDKSYFINEENVKYHSAELKYDLSWDWIMPVAAKITRISKLLGIENHLLFVDITLSVEEIYQEVNAQIEFVQECLLEEDEKVDISKMKEQHCVES